MATPSSFQKAEDDYFLLRGKLQAGRITRAQFDAALKDLMVQDAQGRYWTISGDNGKWFVYDGRAWLEAPLPGAAMPPPPPPPPPSPAPSFSQSVAPPRARNSSGIFLAIGAIVVLCLLGAIVGLAVVGGGFLRVGMAVPTNTPFVVFAPPTPIPPVMPSAAPTAIVVVVTATPPATAAPTTAQPTKAGPTIPPTVAPTLRPTSTPTLVPTLNYVLAFSDDFSNPESGLPETVPFSRYYEQGEYFLHVYREDYVATTVKDQLTLSDFSLETDARVVDGPESAALGVVFRYKDSGNYYELLVNSRGEYLLGKRENKAWQTIGPASWTASPHIKTSKYTNRLRIVARGPDVTAYANNQLLLAVRDTSFSQGYIGVAAQTPKGVPAIKVAFDNLVVTSAADAAAATLFKDDFSSVGSGWGEWTPVGELKYENGEYTEQVNDDTISVYGMYTQAMVADVALEVGGHIVQNPGAATLGIIFRAKDKANYYEFRVDGQGQYKVEKLVNGEWHPLSGPEWAKSPAIQTGGAVNRLKLATRGSDLLFYVNDQYLTTIEDDSFDKGRIGLVASSRKGSGVAKVAFDNLRLYTPAGAPPPMGSPIVPSATSAPAAPVVATATPIPQYPPALYVTDVEVDPPEPKDRTTPTFKVTFLNTLGQTVNVRWFVKIYEPGGKQSFGETAKLNSSFPPGTTTLAAPANWRAVGANPCRPFIARVFTEAADKTILEFPKPGGDSFSFYFAVCPAN